MEDFEAGGQGRDLLDGLFLRADGDFISGGQSVIELRDGAAIHLHRAMLQPLADLGFFGLRKGLKEEGKEWAGGGDGLFELHKGRDGFRRRAMPTSMPTPPATKSRGNQME